MLIGKGNHVAKQHKSCQRPHIIHPRIDRSPNAQLVHQLLLQLVGAIHHKLQQAQPVVDVRVKRHQLIVSRTLHTVIC